MRLTKEDQFGRRRMRNLPELLSIILDDSALYKDKLIEVGNNRSSLHQRAKSKYLGTESNLARDQIVELGDGIFMVESEKNENEFYTCNMKTGYCTCPKGINSAPCKHKSSVSKHYNVAEFSVVPSDDPGMCALYHYLATGTTLPAHMYRRSGGSIPNIDQFIKERLSSGSYETQFSNIHNESLLLDDSAVVLASIENVAQDDDECERTIIENTKINFRQNMEKYTNKIIEMQENNLDDPKFIKAIVAMNKTLKKALKCRKGEVMTQLHEFGKGTCAKRITKSGRQINPNPPARARRLAPGRGPAPKGRRPKAHSGLTKVKIYI